MNKKKVIFLLSSVFCLLSFIWLSKALLLGYYPDFNTQYFVPKLVFSGINPYLGGNDLYTPQVYPPTEFIFFLPFSLLPLEFASYLYTSFSIVCLLGTLIFLSKTFQIKFLSSLNFSLMGLVFMMFPAKFTLGMGQINMIVLILLVLSFWFLKQKKELVSGIFLGVSLVIKIFPVLLPVYFLFLFKRKMLLGITTSIIISGLLVLVFIPFSIYSKFIFDVLPSLLSSWKLDYYNQSLGGFVGRSFGTEAFAVSLKTILSGLILLSAFYVVVKNKKKDFEVTALKFGLLITANLLLNTFSWQHHFVWLVIPFYATFFHLRKMKAKWLYYFLLGVSYILVSTNFKDPGILPTIFQSHVFFGAFILLLLDLYLLYIPKQLAKTIV